MNLTPGPRDVEKDVVERRSNDLEIDQLDARALDVLQQSKQLGLRVGQRRRGDFPLHVELNAGLSRQGPDVESVDDAESQRRRTGQRDE